MLLVYETIPSSFFGAFLLYILCLYILQNQQYIVIILYIILYLSKKLRGKQGGNVFRVHYIKIFVYHVWFSLFLLVDLTYHLGHKDSFLSGSYTALCS